MPMRMCLNCIYLCWDPRRWLRSLAMDEPLVPMCANHPLWPGQLREVPGTACRNYKPKPPEPDESDDTVRRIPLPDGQFAIVDAADYEWLSQWQWLSHCGYAMRNESHKKVYMHRQIMQPPKGMYVDHANHNRADNRRRNLRVCTFGDNSCNRSKRVGGLSRFKGVTWNKRRQKWHAKIVRRGHVLYSAFFDDEVEAARAYDLHAVEYFGEFGCLNFPEEWPPERKQKVYADGQPLREALAAKAEKGKSRKAKGKSTPTRARTQRRKERERSTRGARRTAKKPPRKKPKGPVGFRRTKRN